MEMKMKYVDTTVTVVFILAMVVIYFFWGCHLDLYVTALAGLIVLVTAMVRFAQNKKLKELGSDEEMVK